MRGLHFPCIAFTTLTILSSSLPTIAGTIYVDANAGGANKGSSWEDAYTDLQSALQAAVSGDEIWVVAGTYKPTTGIDREATFQLKNGVAVYGGFAGSETALEERDWETNLCTLSGDIGQAQLAPFGDFPPPPEDMGDPQKMIAWFENRRAHLHALRSLSDCSSPHEDNSLHVVTGSGTDATAIIDGFTITDGTGGGLLCPVPDVDWAVLGGGMLNVGGSPFVHNVIFSRNRNLYAYGVGGVANIDGSHPLFENVRFEHSDGYSVGAMYNRDSSPTLRNVSFLNSYGDAAVGTLLNSGDSYPVLENVDFLGGLGWYGTGGMWGSAAVMRNVKFRGNGTVYGLSTGGALDLTGDALVTACQFWGNWGGRGAVSIQGNPTFLNCAFGDNGGYLVDDLYVTGSPSLTNVTFHHSEQSHAPAVINETGDMVLANTIVWNDVGFMIPPITNESGSVLITHSLIQDSGGSGPGWDASLGIDGGGNLDADPLFVDGATGDLRLTPFSPAINAGLSSALPPEITTDIDGNPRVHGYSVDMGAYEWQGSGDIIQAFHFTPNTLNRGADGRWLTSGLVTVFPYSSKQVDPTTLLLNAAIAPDLPGPTEIHDATRLQLLFDRAEVTALLPVGMEVPVWITGAMEDGTAFRADDVLRVIDPAQAKAAVVEPLEAVAGQSATVFWPELSFLGPTYRGYLSVDGGLTWERIFDGVQDVTEFRWGVPATDSKDARVIVEAPRPEGSILALSNAFSISSQMTGMNQDGPSPGRFGLSIAPNPFNPATTIRYSVRRDGPVTLHIYDLAGRLVRTLVETHQTAGEHEIQWMGRDDQGIRVASGAYLAQLCSFGQVLTRRLVLLK